MNVMLKASLLGLLMTAGVSQAADYKIDTKGAHASVQVKVKHLGYSWLTARFNEFSGSFSYDKDDLSKAKIAVTVNTGSFDSNHAKRDKHVKSEDFLLASDFPEAKFESSSVTAKSDGGLTVKGKLTLRGVSKDIVIDAVKIGEGKDPWGGYRVGFSGTSKITMKDFGIPMDLGPASAEAYLELNIEGIRQ